MKANDFMLGDWVRIKDSIDPNDAYWMHDDFHPGQAIMVEEILSNGVNPDWCGGEINDYIPEDAIEPIPLTPEIMKKNGWKKDSGGEECWANSKGWFTPHEYGKRDTIKSWEVEIYGKPNSFDGVIKYVHQLQHALRLCRIKKEIEL